MAPEQVDRPRRVRGSHARTWGKGFVVKLVLMALINAFGVYVALAAWAAESHGILVASVVLVAAADWVYFSRRTLPLKYVMPGLVFLLVFQIFVIAYTGVVAFTNYGAGHNSTKSHAIDALLIQNERRVEGSAAYPLTVVRAQGALGEGPLGFALTDEDGRVRVGTAEQPLQDVEDAVVEDGRLVEVPGYEIVPRDEVLRIGQEVTQLRVPITDDPEDGSVRTQDARNGFAYRSFLVYDEETDTMRNTQTGVVYRPNDRGSFVSEDGERLNVGWRVNVGWENFTTAFDDDRYAGPFLKVLAWTVAFSVLSVATTFLLGLFLAMVFNDPRLRGRKIYRTLMILPYAFPGFLAALLFAGLLNRRFGFINSVLLGGAEINWLTDPTLAKLSILAVNLWAGFPYMFLICTGALQAIPGDVLEAAKIDGAGRLRTWRSVIMPLLLVAVAPLLISSFAFNFNNFNLIYMLTGGGPRFTDTSAPIGHTDILITMVYSISGLDGTAPLNYGLASALSIVIFLIVATISAIAFRRTRSLEDIN